MFELTPELEKERVRIEALARDFYKLDFFDTQFLLVPSRYLNQLASHTGFPNRYRHWTHGLEYERLKRSYEWGLGKIYEMVINNNPSYAYLMENNSITEQKLVMAHVFGHVAVFKNNLYFSATNRNMIDGIARNASKLDRYYQKYGIDEVESFLDACLSIEEHIDCFAPFVKKEIGLVTNSQTEDQESPEPAKVKCDEHLDMFINPKKELDEQRKKLQEKLKKQPWFPEKPQKDILLFLLQHAPLKKWQEDVLAIIREESYYFNPQRQTKILNEGFASYFHHRMMVEHLLSSSEVIEFSTDHAGTLARNAYNLNPYYLGFTLLHDIEKRYNEGRFGRDYESCSNAYEKENWNKPGMDGYKKLMEIMVIDNDYSLIDKYFTKEYCEEHNFYKYEFNPDTSLYEIKSRDFHSIKNQVLDQLANSGIPYIVVVDGNYNNRNELLLLHKHEFDLNIKYAEDTLKNIHLIWKRPVHLLTKHGDEPKMLSYGATDGGMSEETAKSLAADLYAGHRARI